MTSPRIVDRTAGWLAVAFLVTLLAGEVALSLPDEHAPAASVAAFYAAHRGVVVGLQIAGPVSDVLLAAVGRRPARHGGRPDPGGHDAGARPDHPDPGAGGGSGASRRRWRGCSVSGELRRVAL
jgi:hypothetical protein